MTVRATGQRSCRVSLALLALAASAAHADCTETSYAKLKPPVYPPSAVAAKAEGHVLIEVTVSVDGVPGDFVVRKSSGNADLDQAARDAVSAWRFNPSLCDGKPAISRALVPFDFSLNEDPTGLPSARMLPNDDAPAGSGAVALPDDRELRPDPAPIGAANAAVLLAQLRNDESVDALEPRQIDATTRLTVFIKPEEREVFDVVQSTEHDWNAVSGGGWTSIMRMRFVFAERMTRELYAQVCDGDDDWCRFRKARYLQSMRGNPPPIPPPAPRRHAPGER